MPLRDHFRPPLSAIRQWNSFHHAWAVGLATALNRVMPPGYVAVPHAVYGIEIDVACTETDGTPGVPPAWEPPTPTMTIPASVGTARFGITVRNFDLPSELAAAIELVSPANKDRPASRDAFVGKCLAYLDCGAGVMIVDVVTSRLANLHDELLARLAPCAEPLAASLYAASYRPTSGEMPSPLGTQVRGVGRLDIWQVELVLGEPLPTMPLALLQGPVVPVDLESVYEGVLKDLRVPPRANGTHTG